MWKTITQPEQIKNYPVGTRVRVDGQETTITYHYWEGDYGFKVDKCIVEDTHVFAHHNWGWLPVEVWDGPSLQEELTAALKSVIGLVDRDVIHVRPSERDQFLEALEQWNTVLAKVEESK